MHVTHKHIKGLVTHLIAALCILGSISAQDTVRQAYNEAADKAIDDEKLAVAERLLNAAVTAAEMANKVDPVYIDSLSSLAYLRLLQGRYAEGDAIATKALQLAESRSIDSRRCLDCLASLKGAQDLFGESASLFRRSIEMNEKAEGLEGPNVVISLQNLSVVLYLDQKYAEGEATLRRAIAIEQKARPESEGLVRSLVMLADRLCRQHRYLEADKELSSALSIIGLKVVSAKAVRRVKETQGLLLLTRFEFEKAASLCDDLLKSCDPEECSPATLSMLIDSQWALGRDADARQQIVRLVQLERKEESELDKQEMLIFLCEFEILQSNFSQALKYAENAIDLSLTKGPSNDELYWQLALLHDIKGDKKNSADYLTKAIELSRSNSVDGDPDYLDTLGEKVDRLLVAGRHREAEVAARMAWKSLRETRGAEHVDTVGMMKKLSQALRMQNRVQEADVWSVWSEGFNKIIR